MNVKLPPLSSTLLLLINATSSHLLFCSVSYCLGDLLFLLRFLLLFLFFFFSFLSADHSTLSDFNAISTGLHFTGLHFQNGHHNTAQIQHCLISTTFQMWVDYDVPKWFLTSKNFYRSPFSKWPPQYRTNSTLFDFKGSF